MTNSPSMHNEPELMPQKIHLNPITLSFNGKYQDLEQDFINDYSTKSLNHIRTSLFLGLILYAVFGFLDAALAPEQKTQLWFIRYAVVCPCIFISILLSMIPGFVKYVQACLVFLMILAGSGISIMVAIANPPANYSYYAGVILVLMMGYGFIKARFMWASLSGWINVLFYEIVAIWIVQTPGDVFLNNNFFFISANIIGMFICYSNERYARTNYYMALQLEFTQKKTMTLNRELEQRVKERIADINQTNERLQKEIEAHKKEKEERKQAEKELMESEEKFRTLVNTAPFGIRLTDLEGKIVYSNPAHHKIQGYGPYELIGMYIWDFIANDSHRAQAREYYQAIISKEPDQTVYFSRDRTRDGREIDVQINWDYIRNENNKVTGIISILEDITYRKQAEAEREKLQAQLNQAQKLESIGTLAGGIAHDFNNLLYVVMGNISLALDDLKLDIEISENLKEAEKACIKAKELSAQMITFSKGGDPVKKRMSINGLLKDTVVSTLSGSTITPKISIADDIRHVNIDEDQIRQVVHNIVVNAKEAMDDNGQLTVSCENVDMSEKGHLTLNQGEYIKLSFKDQGCGILKENLEKIFDPYFSTKDMGTDKGQGLGLTVCYSIIQKHGGLIHVESEPQTGSTFSVYLPAASFKNPELQNLRKKQIAQKSARKPVVGKEKILLMDDEDAVRTFMCQVINRLGYNVETCVEGKEAVEIYTKAMESKEPFDVVILDLTNKIGMGGQETMKKLLELDRDVKGIIITGYSDDPVVANFRAYGFSGVIIKPATKDELSKVINEVLS